MSASTSVFSQVLPWPPQFDGIHVKSPAQPSDNHLELPHEHLAKVRRFLGVSLQQRGLPTLICTGPGQFPHTPSNVFRLNCRYQCHIFWVSNPNFCHVKQIIIKYLRVFIILTKEARALKDRRAWDNLVRHLCC